MGMSSATAIPSRLTLGGAADAITATELRRALQRWLRQVAQASEEVRDDIVLCANEALANCVEHAYRPDQGSGTMQLQARHDPAAQSIRVCVRDRGTWKRRPVQQRNDTQASRGIMLMHALADHCIIEARPSGTTVCLDYSTKRSGNQRP